MFKEIRYMEETKYIVAIDLGTSHFTGIVGEKHPDGTVSILAMERESVNSCIRRGVIYKTSEIGPRIKRLTDLLQNRMDGTIPYRMEKIYVGIGLRSLRSMEHSVSRSLSTDAAVSTDDLRALDKQCREYSPEWADVVGIAPPLYSVDGKQVEHPEGHSGRHLAAHYRLITEKPQCRKAITECVAFAGFKLAGLIPSPQSLAEATLSPEEKKAGCLFINFGAGMTSAVIYKGGAMVHLSMIPLGGHVITKDLMQTLELKEPDAEWLKTRYGLMLAGKDKNVSDTLGQTEIGGKVIALKKMNAIIEARTKEIVENIYAQVERSVGKPALLAAGIVLTGGASNLNSLPELLRQRFNLEVRYAAIRKEWLHIHENKAGNPDYITAISLLIAGTENCLSYVPPPLPPEPPVESQLPDESESLDELEPLSVDRKKTGSLFDILFGGQDRKDDGKKDTSQKQPGKKQKLIDKVNNAVSKLIDDEPE